MEQKYEFLKIFIEKLARKELGRKGQNIPDDYEVTFMDAWKMPTTWVMKMMYFTLLKITESTQNMQYSFAICNNYEAWRFGPVEVDAYNMIKEPFHEYSIYEKWNQQLEEVDENIANSIQQALDALYNDENFSQLIGNTDSLISLSHNLFIWPYTVDKHLSVMDMCYENVSRDISMFNDEIKHNIDKYLYY